MQVMVCRKSWAGYVHSCWKCRLWEGNSTSQSQSILLAKDQRSAGLGKYNENCGLFQDVGDQGTFSEHEALILKTPRQKVTKHIGCTAAPPCCSPSKNTTSSSAGAVMRAWFKSRKRCLSLCISACVSVSVSVCLAFTSSFSILDLASKSLRS